MPAGIATSTTSSPAHYTPATTTAILQHHYYPATLAFSRPQNANLRVYPLRPDGTIISFMPRRRFNRFDLPWPPRTHQNTHPAHQTLYAFGSSKSAGIRRRVGIEPTHRTACGLAPRLTSHVRLFFLLSYRQPAWVPVNHPYPTGPLRPP